MKNTLIGIIITLPVIAWSQDPSASEILQKIDENTIAGNRTATTSSAHRSILRGRAWTFGSTSRSVR